NPFPMTNLLLEHFEWNRNEAQQITSFLTPMLAFDRKERATAAQCLQHDWLQPAPAAAAEGEETGRNGQHLKAGEGRRGGSEDLEDYDPQPGPS
ncbi:hypothetical protein PENTCL1PPCAC_10590, partial [Pristionchus entomophagus]